MKRAVFVGMALAILLGCQRQESGFESMIPEGPSQGQVKPNPNRPADDIDLTEDGSFVLGTTAATIIDTRRFKPQINSPDPFRGRVKSTSSGRPGKFGLPEIPAGAPNHLRPGGIADFERIQPTTNFPGIAQTEWNPPDPSLAVGPEHIVQTVNMTIAFYTKSGELQFQQRLNDTEQPGFFDDVNAGNFTFDPKCFFDHYEQRFVVLALEVYGQIDESYITIAVSDDADPNGTWYKYRTFAVVEVDGSSYWVDYPGLGYDADGYYVTANLFILEGSGPGFGGVLFRSFEKGPLISGQPAQFADIRSGQTSSVQVAQHFGGDNPAPYFVSRSSGSLLRITTLNDPFTSPSFEVEFVDIPVFSGPPDIENGGNFLDALDGRLMNAHWRDGSLWTCHAIANATETGSLARWYEVSLGEWPDAGTPTLVQSGDIDPGDGSSTFFPAIYTDEFNNAALVVGHASSTETPSVQATGRLASDPLGTMAALTVLQPGVAFASGRWGDYFDIALDPVDGFTFWMVGEHRENDGWRTTVNSFTLFLLGDVNHDGAVNLLDVNPFVVLLSTGGFDEAADINQDGSLNLLDIEGFVLLISGN